MSEQIPKRRKLHLEVVPYGNMHYAKICAKNSPPFDTIFFPKRRSFAVGTWSDAHLYNIIQIVSTYLIRLTSYVPIALRDTRETEINGPNCTRNGLRFNFHLCGKEQYLLCQCCQPGEEKYFKVRKTDSPDNLTKNGEITIDNGQMTSNIIDVWIAFDIF